MPDTETREQCKERWRIDMLPKVMDKKIVDIRWMTTEEADAMGWGDAPVVLILEDGTQLFPSRDDEGNGAGALFGQSGSGEELTFPVI